MLLPEWVSKRPKVLQRENNMSRIVLKNLLRLTEQAPQPPPVDPMMGGAAPVPAPVAPPQGMNAGDPNQQPPPEAPDTSPEPEDPSEYDFTKDFRAFEDKKNKAEAEAKKVLLDKMNERLLNKTIVANASRGYGQPKTDYTIEGVKKISVEFWYKDYVVIATDSNDKKYFLTPGINIKIESEGSEPAPGAPPAGQEAPPQEEPQSPEGSEEAPNAAPQGGSPSGEQPPPAVPEEPAQQAAPMAPEQPPQQAGPPATTVVQPPQGPPAQEPQPLKKKKKKPVAAETIQRDLTAILSEYMSDRVKNANGQINFGSYIKDAIMTEGKNNDVKIKCTLSIPESHMVRFDSRDIKLNAMDILRENTSYGKRSKGSIDISKRGRYYLLEYVKEIGWNS